MKSFEKLTGAKLAQIINDREDSVIVIDQITANTVGIESYPRIKYQIPVLPSERFISPSSLIELEDRQTLWNTFIVIANKQGASIRFTNPNGVDCYVEVFF